MTTQIEIIPADILTTLATFPMTCSRCGRELTDAASKECGVGPVCRKKSNDVLAVQIPSSPSKARSVIRERERFIRVNDERAQRVLDKVIEAVMFEQDNLDWRVTVKRVEWLLATGQATGMMREVLYEVVEALGYVAIVSLWRGELALGSTKPTAVTFMEGRLVLTSVRPPRVVIDKIKAIKGRRFDGNTKAWTFPSEAADELCDIVVRHFLAPQGVEEAVRKAKEHAEKCATGPAPAPRPRYEIIVSNDGREAAIVTPYDPEFVADLKDYIAHHNRRWNGRIRAWEVFGEANITRARRLCESRFGAV